MKRLCLKVDGKIEQSCCGELVFETKVLLRCERVVATPDPAKAYLC
jgi:hypothetical protein